MSRVLDWTVRLLPSEQRPWGDAIRAEAHAIPAGATRIRWVGGGLWSLAREAGQWRGLARLVLAAGAGAGLVLLGWHPGSANPAMPTDRVGLIVTVCLLAVLPWVVRLLYGTVAANPVARAVRVGGYVGVYALLLTIVGLSRFAGSRFDHFQAFDQANWEAEMRSGAFVGALVTVGIIGVYATAVLVVTAERAAMRPRTLAAATLTGIGAAVIGYVLMPFGGPLYPNNGWFTAGYTVAFVAVPVAAGWALWRLRVGPLGGLWAGGTAALTLAVLTIATMLAFPGHVTLEWANPSPLVPHGTPYEVQMSVGDAALKYLVGLLFGPLAGLLLGAGSRADKPVAGSGAGEPLRATA
jgi:hypothetical protein